LKHHHAPLEFGLLSYFFFEPQPLINGINVEAAHAIDGKVRDDDAIVTFPEKYLAKLGGDAQATFTIECMFKAATKHVVN
jgi:hypothetical protein